MTREHGTGGNGGGAYRERTYSSQDGLALYYRDYGDRLSSATPVLCLAGLTRNCKDFRDLALRLAAGRRVLCPDYRGRGRSQYDRDWRRYVPATYVDDLRHLLAAANVHAVVVVGTSLGGILAAAMAVAMPCAVAGAVLNDIGPDIEPRGMARLIAYLRDDHPQPDWAAAARHLRQTLPDLPVHGEEGWLTFARNTYREGDDGRLTFDWDPALIKPVLRGGGTTTDLWPAFRALRGVPVLAVRGAKSDVLGAATFARMAEALPGLAQISVPGVGHVPDLAQAETLEAIHALLARA